IGMCSMSVRFCPTNPMYSSVVGNPARKITPMDAVDAMAKARRTAGRIDWWSMSKVMCCLIGTMVAPQKNTIQTYAIEQTSIDHDTGLLKTYRETTPTRNAANMVANIAAAMSSAARWRRTIRRDGVLESGGGTG